MEHLGIVCRSSSPWSSPLHMVKKSNGSWRPCGDYRRLNDITRDDRYPLPHIQDLNANLAGKTIFFPKIDHVRGYNQIPVAPEDIPKTAVITPFGLYEFLKMPFGLKNAASKLRSKLALTDHAGWTNYQSWCLASGQRGKKTLTLLLFFSPMAQTSECLAISFHPHVQTRCSHPVRLSKNCKKNWENFPLSPFSPWITSAVHSQELAVSGSGVPSSWRPKGPPSDGPFPVLTRADKHFDISEDGKAVRVSLDRLKPAFSPQTFPRLSQDPCVSEQQDPHALQEDHTAIIGDAVGLDRAARSDDVQGIVPAPAPSPLSDASPPQVTSRSGRLVQKPKKYRTFYRLSRVWTLQHRTSRIEQTWYLKGSTRLILSKWHWTIAHEFIDYATCFTLVCLHSTHAPFRGEPCSTYLIT